MTTTTLYGQTTQTVDGNGSGNAGTIGLHFTVSAAGTLGGIWYYSNTGCTQLPTSIALWTTQASPATGTLVTSQTPSWSGAAGSGWVFAAFTSPPSLSTGVDYMAAVFRNDAVNVWFVFDSTYTWPKATSPITAPKDVAAGQGWYDNVDTTLHFPSSQLASFNWYIDVSVVTGTSHTATASVTVAPSASAARVHGNARSGAVTVTPSPAAGRAHAQARSAALTVTPSPGAFANGRSQYTWPFSWDSIWNLPVAATAEYAPTGISVDSDYSTDASAVEYCCTDPAQPVKSLTNALLPGGGTGAASVYVPPAMSAPGTWNDCGAFLGTDNDTVYQGQTLDLTAGGNPSWGGDADVPSAPVSLTGAGITGAHGGSGLSALGGTLTTADLTGSDPIRHAMKVCFNGFLYYSSAGTGFAWPAVSADDGYSNPSDPNYYGGANPAVVLGALLALPPFISPSKYADPLVQKIATAMQCYGAYIVDNTASGAGVSDSLIELNYDAAPHFAGTGTFADDFHALLEDLQVVTSSAEATPGGGAIGSDRFAPYAPAFADGSDPPDAMTVVEPASVLMESLADSFPGTTLNAQWGDYGTVAVSGGQAAIEATTGESGVYSASGHMLTGSHMLAKVTPYTGGTGPYTYFQAVAETGSGGAGIQYNSGSIFAYWIDGTGTVTNLSSLTYSATTHAWWRVREDSGTTYFDTSADGSSWTNRWSAASPVIYNSMLAQVGSGIGSGTAGNTLLADFNVPSAVPRTAAAALTVTPAVSAAGHHPRAASASVTATPATAAQGHHPRTAAASLTVSPSPSAAAAHGQHAAASLTVTPATSAASTVGTAAALTVTPSASAAAVQGHARSASVTAAPSASAAGHHPRTASAAVTVAPSTSAAAGGQPRTASAALTVTPSAAAGARHGNARAAAVTVTPAAAAAAVIGSAAAVTVTPAVSAAGAAARHRTAATATTPAAAATAAHGAVRGAAVTALPSAAAAAAHGHAAAAALTVTPSAAAAGTGGGGGTPGKLLTEAGGALRAEAGGRLLDEAGGGGGSAHTAAAALTVAVTTAAAAPGASGGKLLTEAGGAFLTEAGGDLLTEGGSGGGGAHTASASLLVAAATAAAASGGTPAVPFPRRPLDLDCELLLGTAWTSTKPWVYQRAGDSPPVTISRGRPDESAQANPASSSWEWNNRDGRFSPRNPLSPLFGQLGRNTPVRWSVPAASSYLRLENNNDDRAAIVDSASINISGSIEMRLALRLTDWRACVLAAKQDGGGCWQWLLNDDGTMTFGWQTPGSGPYLPVTSNAAVPYTSGDFTLRVIMNAATATVTFYAAPGSSLDPAQWTQLGDSLTYGFSTSIAVTSSPLCIGWSLTESTQQLCGRVYAYRLYNGIGGTVAASPDFTVQAPGASSFSDAQGNRWLIQGGTSGARHGAEVCKRNYRFHGEMSSQPPKWDVTGQDMAVAATAGGPLRRLGQGSANAMSAMKRAVLAQGAATATIAYWTMEDAAGATQFGPAIGPNPMTFGQSPAPVLATDSTFLASAPLPQCNGAPMQGKVAPHGGSTAWTVRFLCDVGTLPSAGGWTLAKVAATGECTSVFVNVWSTGNLSMVGYKADGTTAFDTGQIAWLGGTISGQALWWSVEATEISGGIHYALVTVAPGAAAGFFIGADVTTSAVIGNVTSVQLNPYAFFTDTAFGHLSVASASASIFSLAQPLNAWSGERAAGRYARLAEENGYQVRILGSPAYSAAMGPQGIDTLGNLLQECETADLGMQFEPRQQLALGYRTLASMLNQAPAVTLDYSASQPGGAGGDESDSGLDPVYDDALTRNDWTLTRGSSTGTQGATWQSQLDDGSAMSVSDPRDGGVGDYASSQTVNVQADGQLPDVAGWMVHAGTVDEARWPAIPFNLARAGIQDAGLYYPLLDAEGGDFLELANMPEQVTYDRVRQLALGMTEALGGFHHVLTFNAEPESPYEVMVLDDEVFGTGDTDGSQLHVGVDAAATSLQVATTGASGIPWTTSPGDFPLDIVVGGERMTVIGIASGAPLQVFTVIRAVNGVSKPQAAGADVRLWSAPILSLA